MVEFTSDHYKELCRWYFQWNQPSPTYESLPTYGLIEPGVAAGFLITSDSNIGFLDFFISNRNSDDIARSKALDKIVNGLIARGSAIGLKYFKCDTQLQAIRDRAAATGFEYLGEFSNFILKL